MISYLKPALKLFILLSLLTGLAYPLVVSGLASLLFPEQAAGSLLKDEQGRVFGSGLIGQAFSNPDYFWGRPSMTPDYPYNAAISGGSNLGFTNPALTAAVRDRLARLKELDPTNNLPVPVDLVTASASGLDPHISPAAAAYQINRIALRHKLPESQIRQLVDSQTEPRQWGIFGEPRVNVLKLNYELDKLIPRNLGAR